MFVFLTFYYSYTPAHWALSWLIFGMEGRDYLFYFQLCFHVWLQSWKRRYYEKEESELLPVLLLKLWNPSCSFRKGGETWVLFLRRVRSPRYPLQFHWLMINKQSASPFTPLIHPGRERIPGASTSRAKSRTEGISSPMHSVVDVCNQALA